MNVHLDRRILPLLFSLTLLIPASLLAQAPRFEIKITNLTHSQTFTPILAATHRPGVTLFTPGESASQEIEILAEEGNPAPLAALLSANSDVLDVTDSGEPLPPGASVTLSLQAGSGFDHISVAAMLIPTNDAFFAINDAPAPSMSTLLTGHIFRILGLSPNPPLFANAYDAGTEANDELCSNIPGPPDVCQGEGFNASREGAEGFVHIHRGIRGSGDLDANRYDWRNPVAEVVVTRVP